MSRYFFNVYDGEDMYDEKGKELSGVREMRLYMLTMATRIIADVEVQKDSWQMEVLDESGQMVASMDFGINDRTM